MRAFWTVIHRWAGLTIALFLIVAGLTGAVTSWDHEPFVLDYNTVYNEPVTARITDTRDSTAISLQCPDISL
ncbi:PepSY-associated transmembrane protein [Janthinobacterium sp. 64]|nr:PepSY-associated transmembrane protein [Janthinobacterium sp. 64]